MLLKSPCEAISFMYVVVHVFWGGGGGEGEGEGGTLFSQRLRLWFPEPRRDRGRNVKKNKMVFFKNILHVNGHGQDIA